MVVPTTNYCKNMDNRIVLELIKKDLDELQILVDALQKDEFPNQLLIDITIGRTKTLLQEFSLLEGVNTGLPTEETVKVLEDVDMKIAEPDMKPEPDSIQAPVDEPEAPVLKKTEVDEVQPETREEEKTEEPDETAEVADEIQEEQPEPVVETLNDDEPIEEESTDEEMVEEAMAPEIEPEEVTETAVKEVAENQPHEAADQPEEMMNEPIEPTVDKKILGERFVSEPTLNEKLAAAKNQESKVKGKPVTSLKGAIGLNDRFMFTRELFGNNREKFDKTIDNLDACETLIAAIEYLEQNFKWTKNETSLKFIGLVKQRFSK